MCIIQHFHVFVDDNGSHGVNENGTELQRVVGCFGQGKQCRSRFAEETVVTLFTVLVVLADGLEEGGFLDTNHFCQFLQGVCFEYPSVVPLPFALQRGAQPHSIKYIDKIVLHIIEGDGDVGIKAAVCDGIGKHFFQGGDNVLIKECIPDLAGLTSQ